MRGKNTIRLAYFYLTLIIIFSVSFIQLDSEVFFMIYFCTVFKVSNRSFFLTFLMAIYYMNYMQPTNTILNNNLRMFVCLSVCMCVRM